MPYRKPSKTKSEHLEFSHNIEITGDFKTILPNMQIFMIF